MLVYECVCVRGDGGGCGWLKRVKKKKRSERGEYCTMVYKYRCV